MRPPTADDAARIARDVLGEPMASVERFITGAGNYVYDVTSAGGVRAVVRFSRDRDECAAGVYWSQTLRPLGVPLPRMLAHHVAGEGEIAWTVLERFSGVDLGDVCHTLTHDQLLGVLDRVLRAQQIVRSLPPGPGYGFVNRPDEAHFARWQDVILDGLRMSRERIVRVDAVDIAYVGRVESLLPRFEDYFASVAPTPFLDDTTTRNVIVHNGVFQGIVDVDSICYGDPLLVPALTRMALLNLGCATFYTDAWLDRVGASPERRRAVDFYTAFFAVNFLSEQGQQFNRDAPPPVDPARVARLISILDGLLRRL